ncbi:hypothetical protein OG455_12025 [Kitasatospora sp. NBC_01287]|uniref:hypothetical protein n=1 Tax=Kitasatospora sp. NBC_01287 TaxID=2903573 RepID=UPI0022535690|nr:hypothetical protein [Kitasatospora sp. NBC_01287]MCX4746244.1 hypothetical protein [Kitasatospora sp. NBC_01287]
MARQGRISGRTLAGAAAIAVAATGLLAGSASAHDSSVTETCSGLTVKLTDYNASVTNTITVVVDGKTLLDHQTFKTSFDQTFPVDPKHTAVIDTKVAVVAGDDATGKHPTWTFTVTPQIPVCPPSPSPSPSPSISSSPSPSPSPSTASPSPSPSPSTASPTPSPTPTPSTSAPTTSAKPTSAAPVVKPTTPAPKPSSTSPSLAFTGGGSDSGLIAGVGAGVVVLGGGLVFLSRRRRAGRH